MSYNGIGKTVSFGSKGSKTSKNAKFVKTDKLLEMFEKCFTEGNIPWSSGIIRNAFNTPSKGATKVFDGVNQLITYISRLYGHFDSDTFLTANEINKRGGMIKKGSKSTPIVYPVIQYFDDEGKKITKKQADELEDTTSRFVGYVGYSEFNLAQTTLEYEHLTDLKDLPKKRKNKSAETIIKNYTNCPKIDIATGVLSRGADGCYYPLSDKVEIPPMNAFKDKSVYYSTLFHELMHSTEHETRLNVKNGRFASNKYAECELRAEIGASILMSYTDMEYDLTRSKAYIQSWGKQFKDMKNFTDFFASVFKSALKGANYILGLTETEQKKEIA